MIRRNFLASLLSLIAVPKVMGQESLTLPSDETMRANTDLASMFQRDELAEHLKRKGFTLGEPVFIRNPPARKVKE